MKSPKLYMSDSGLASYLTGTEAINFISPEPLVGALFETYIAQNLLSIINARWTEARLYFWNVQGRYEVDFVLESGSNCLAIEIKSTARWEDRDLHGLKAFLSTTPHCRVAILGYNGTDAVRVGEKLWALPISPILS